MEKKLLFVASLPNDKLHFDGERNKSKIVLECINTIGNYSVSIIDYTKNKYLQSVKMLFFCLFHKYDCVFISKCIVGGTLALHMMLPLLRKNSNIVFYIIGNGYNGFEDKKMYLEDLKRCKKIIVESDKVADQMSKISIKTNLIFPCIKKDYQIKPITKKYKNGDPIMCIYFSRIDKNKGLLDAVKAIIKINSESTTGPIAFLDIAGGVDPNDGGDVFEKEILNTINGHSEIRYLGTSFCIKGSGSYVELQKYDLHIFPSHFNQECAPGSIIDMFIAGVPTISSNFESSKNIMSPENSYFFKMGDVNDLANKLVYIWNHKEELNRKRILSFEEKNKYSEKSFVDFLQENAVI